jgi:hypothetical protein
MNQATKTAMRKEIVPALVWAAIMLGVALAAKFANELGYIDGDIRLRVVAMNGLWLAYYGNRMPKAFVPSACARQARRFTAWTLVVSGLIYAGFWAFAPIPMAAVFGTGSVAAGVALVLGYCLTLRGRTRPVA